MQPKLIVYDSPTWEATLVLLLMQESQKHELFITLSALLLTLSPTLARIWNILVLNPKPTYSSLKSPAGILNLSQRLSEPLQSSWITLFSEFQQFFSLLHIIRTWTCVVHVFITATSSQKLNERKDFYCCLLATDIILGTRNNFE